MDNKGIIANETPIKSIEEDLLNFKHYAKKIQKIIQGYAGNPEPLTIGIYGKWGMGKTSLLSLIERNLEIFNREQGDKKYIKFHYTPWIYQTQEEMLFDFFEILSSKLIYQPESNLKKAGTFIKKYSRYLKAVKLSASVGIPKMFNAGISIEPHEILQKLGEDLEGQDKNLNDLKDEINSTLLTSDKKIIIFIDDVDRLDKDEIFTLFKLIKANADFQNLVFIICFDHNYVAKAIHRRYGDDPESGEEFLEKIINIPLELPLIEEADLDYFVKKELKDLLSSRKIRKTDSDELLSSLKGRYFDSPREIIRIRNSFAISLYAIGDEVNIHDLFWVEYLKIKHNKTYQAIKKYASNFKGHILFSDIINFNNLFSQEKSETGLRKELSVNHKHAFDIIEFLFPVEANGTVSAFQKPILKPKYVLDTELRINHRNHFEKYFSFHVKGKISEILFHDFTAKIKSEDYENAKATLEEMINSSGERKIVYRLKSEIENLNDDDLLKKLVQFVVNNLGLFSGISNIQPHSIELLQEISKKLTKKPYENANFIVSISKQLTYTELCWFFGLFLNIKIENLEFIETVKTILINKVKGDEGLPFFTNRNISKMIMDIWSQENPSEFKNYLLKNLNSKENIDAFITSFPKFYNNNINGVFKEEYFIYITTILKIESKLIFEKIKEHIPETKEIKTYEDIDTNWKEYTNNSAIDNIMQFCYWHLQKVNPEM
jgi:hypothetical protein